MSTGMRGSKFGVSLGEKRQAILEAFAGRPWLRALHVHTGSQGYSLDSLVEGIRRVMALGVEIRASCGRPLAAIDIGGGMPVDYRSDAGWPRFGEYAAALRERVPELFEGEFKIVTEFGRSLHAKAGWTASRVEYTKQSGGRRIAVVHAGADLFLRTAYMPETWPLRITVYQPDGTPKEGATAPWDIAGPLCFSGDFIARDRELPAIEPGDLVVVHDTGAYTLTMWSRYNSRLAPAVWGHEGDPPRLGMLKPAETMEQLLGFWE
jgi:diaminopimelate decarboxylase